MSYLASNFVSSLAFALIWASANGQLDSLVPEGLLDFIPESCTPQIMEDVLPCALENLCFALLPSDEEIAAIPAQSEIQSCADVDAGLCPITSRCPACKEVSDKLFKCIIVGSSEDGALMQNVTDLVMGCSLDCATVVADEGEAVPDSEAPIAAPVEEEEEAPNFEAPVEAPVVASGEGSEAPFEAPVEEESAEAADDSGAMSTTRMASGAAILIGVLSVIL